MRILNLIVVALLALSALPARSLAADNSAAALASSLRMLLIEAVPQPLYKD